jgi:two-component sensor histidine kinase
VTVRDRPCGADADTGGKIDTMRGGGAGRPVSLQPVVGLASIVGERPSASDRMRSTWQYRRFGLLHLASVTLPLLGLMLWAHYSWREEVARATSIAEKNVEISREYLLRAVQTADGAIGQAELVIRGLSWDQIATPEVHERLKQLDEQSDLPWGIGIIDAKGILRNSSVAFPLGGDLADREYFKALRDGDPGLHVGQVVKTRVSNLATIPVARRKVADGFDGIIVANIRVETLVSFFEKLKADDEIIASVARRDGALLARWPPIEPFMLGPNTPYMRAIANGADHGTYAGTAGADGVDRLYAFARVGELPLYAVYGFSVHRLFEQWLFNFLFASSFALLAGMLMWSAASRVQVVQRHRDELAAEVEARTAELKAALGEKNMLLREVHHRVKNNLSMMVALVRVIGRKAPAESQSYFRDIAARITAVGKIYSQIHAHGDLTGFDAATYLKEVSTEIVAAFGSERFTLRLDITPVDIDIDTALPLGLIVSELITNALRHAFEGRDSGEILVRLRAEDGIGLLTVRDNGRGLPARTRPSSAGLGLVELLAKQIDGTLRQKTRPEGGAQFRVTFKIGRKEHAPRHAA